MQNLTDLRLIIADLALNGQNYTAAAYSQKLGQADAIVAEYEKLAVRLVPVPVVVVEDPEAVEIARVFAVQGKALAGVRWNDTAGSAFWASGVMAICHSVGTFAQAKIGADPMTIVESILDAAVAEFEDTEKTIESCDPSKSSRTLN